MDRLQNYRDTVQVLLERLAYDRGNNAHKALNNWRKAGILLVARRDPRLRRSTRGIECDLRPKQSSMGKLMSPR